MCKQPQNICVQVKSESFMNTSRTIERYKSVTISNFSKYESHVNEFKDDLTVSIG